MASPAASRPRVLAVASHPIQYHAPWFRALAMRSDVQFRALFIEQLDRVAQGRGFGVAFQWDVPLLEGYEFEFAGDSLRPGWGAGFARVRLRGARSLLRRLAPDVVVMTGWHMAAMAQLLFAARSLGIPVVMRGEANALRPRGAAARLAHRVLLGCCDAFMPIGRASRDFYLGYGIAPDRLFDAPYFVDNERFASAARDLESQRPQLRARWAIPPEAVCFCFAGKLEPKKRILDVIRALRDALPRSTRPLHLLVVGHGEQMEAARAMAATLPVTFAGFLNQSEIPAAYAASDGLVLPSDHGETWGLVVNEAMACSRAAIVSDRVGCGPDLVRDGETGWIFPFGDTSQLAARLVSAADDPQRLASMGRRARELVTRHYNVQACADATARAVHAVLAGR
jgi:glycosyltransferase involved in cell wall biosynthesis